MGQPLEGVNTAGCKSWSITWMDEGKAHSASRKGYANAGRFARNLPATATGVSIDDEAGGCC